MNNARAGRNFNSAPECGAIFFPFIGDGLEITGSKLKIIAVEFTENGGGDLSALKLAAGFDRERSGGSAKFTREILFGEIHIHADAKDDVMDFVHLRGHLGEDAAKLAIVNKNIIRPFDSALDTCCSVKRARECSRGSDGDLGRGLRGECRTEQDGKPQPLSLRRNPGAPETPAAFCLGFGKDHDAFLDAVASEFIGDVVGGGGFLKDADIATDDHIAVQYREEIVGMENVRG